MDDLISRQAAIDAVKDQTCLNYEEIFSRCLTSVKDENGWVGGIKDAIEALVKLPSAQPEIKPIEYRDCVNAMLRMWMDNVVTDWEYNRIMNKLNAHWGMKNG